jgi:hypothetical protein
MGLEERRKLTDLRERAIPEIHKEIIDDTGADIALELDEASFVADPEALNWVEYQGFKYLANACRIIGTDALGKEALQESVKTATWINLPRDRAADKAATLSEGALTVTGAWGMGPGGDGWIGYDELAKIITAAL